MSGQRLRRLRGNQLESRLTELEQQYTELRAGAIQFVGGASIVRTLSQTANAYDWNGFLNDPGGTGYGGKLFQVDAVAQSMNVFWGQCADDLFVDTSSNLYTGLQYMTDYKNNNSPITSTYTDVPSASGSPAAKTWFVQLSGNSSRRLWIKFKVYGLDAATVTVTALT